MLVFSFEPSSYEQYKTSRFKLRKHCKT